MNRRDLLKSAAVALGSSVVPISSVPVRSSLEYRFVANPPSVYGYSFCEETGKMTCYIKQAGKVVWSHTGPQVVPIDVLELIEQNLTGNVDL